MLTVPPPRDAHALVVGSGALADAVAGALAGRGLARVTRAIDPLDPSGDPALPAFAAGASFDLLLDVDLLVVASSRPGLRYLANDAAAIRGIPVIWVGADASGGEVGTGWDESGVDYRDVVPETPEASEHDDRADAAEGSPETCAALADLVTESLDQLASAAEHVVGRVAAYDAKSGRVTETVHHRDPEAVRPGSLEERTAMPDHVTSETVTAPELAAELDGDHPPLLLDVREPWEVELVALPDARVIPLGQLTERVGELDRNAPVVAYCHHGVRSGRALAILQAAGFTRARHLAGGIDAWTTLVDPELPRY